MAKPTLASFSQRLYDELTPLEFDEPAQDYALAKFVAALGQMFQVVDDLGRDNENGEPGWSVLLDVTRSPGYALPWLGQFVGVTVDTALTEAQQRSQIMAAGGWQRGTLASMIAATQPLLTGDKLVLVRERDGDPYVLTVITYASQTPNENAVRAALTAAKPAGIILNYQVFLGQTYAQLFTNHPSYSNVFTTYADYQLLATDLGVDTPPDPGGTLPVGSYGAGAYGAGAYLGTPPPPPPASKVTGVYKFSLPAPGSAPNVSLGVKLRVRALKTSSAHSGSLKVWLYQGATLIQGPFTVPLTVAAVTTELTVSNAAAITDFSTLQVWVQGVSDAGFDLTARVTFAELQTST